jgi:flagellar assembly protein FliH
MAIIKQSSAAAASAKPFSMADIEAHARTLLLRAKQQADQLLAAAQTEAEVLVKEAHAEAMSQGLAAGKKEGLAQGKTEGMNAGKTQAFEAQKKELTEALATINAIAAAFDQQRHEMIEQAESEVLPLALAIARKVTKRMGDLDPRVVEANVREAVRLTTSKHNVQVVIHPSQKQQIEDLGQRLKQQWPQMQHMAIVEDAMVSPGGCRVTTSGGEIDAEIETQLDRLARELVPEPAPDEATSSAPESI